MPALCHPSGAVIEFTDIGERKMMVRRTDGFAFGNPNGVSIHLAKAWWKAWRAEGWQEMKETK